MSVGVLLGSWLELTRERIRPSTYESYELNVRRLGEYLGDIPLLQLTAPDIQSAYRRMRERGLTEHSLNQVHSVLDRALRHAVQWGLIVRNPAVLVFAPRPRRREMTALSAEELMRLLDHAREHRLRPLLVVLGTAGLRIGEALGLRWQDVDLVAGRLVVRQALQRRRGVGLVFVEPKTPRSRRTVHLTSLAVDALAEQARLQARRNETAPTAARSGLVFTNLSGGPIEPGTVNANLSRLLRTQDYLASEFTICATQPRQPFFLRPAFTPRWSRICWVTAPSRSPWTPIATWRRHSTFRQSTSYRDCWQARA